MIAGAIASPQGVAALVTENGRRKTVISRSSDGLAVRVPRDERVRFALSS